MLSGNIKHVIWVRMFCMTSDRCINCSWVTIETVVSTGKNKALVLVFLGLGGTQNRLLLNCRYCYVKLRLANFRWCFCRNGEAGSARKARVYYFLGILLSLAS